MQVAPHQQATMQKLIKQYLFEAVQASRSPHPYNPAVAAEELTKKLVKMVGTQ